MGNHLIIESMPNSVVVKSLSRQSWVVDIGDAGTTVADLKRRLEDMGACESVKQLVYRGTVLMDTERIDAEQIGDGFLVMLAGSVAGVPKPAVEQQDGQGAQREANSAESCVESFWTGHERLRAWLRSNGRPRGHLHEVSNQNTSERAAPSIQQRMKSQRRSILEVAQQSTCQWTNMATW